MPVARKQATVGTKANFPGFIEPALATMVDKPVGGDRWVHEIKFDGYRVQVHLIHGEAKVFTRRGHDWTNHCPVSILGLIGERAQGVDKLLARHVQHQGDRFKPTLRSEAATASASIQVEQVERHQSELTWTAQDT
jgi:ATP-dependent DNA ligase